MSHQQETNVDADPRFSRWELVPPPIYSLSCVRPPLQPHHSPPRVTMSCVPGLLPVRAVPSAQSSHSGNKPRIPKSCPGVEVWNCSFSLTWECDVSSACVVTVCHAPVPSDLTWMSSQVSVPPPRTPNRGFPPQASGMSLSFPKTQSIREQSCEASSYLFPQPENENQVFGFQIQIKANNKPFSSSSCC